jgi:outer membrane protein OmpU
MKKLLLTTALVGVAFVASPAFAEVELGLGGHFKGYVTWSDQDDLDETSLAGGAAAYESRSVDMLRETEVHFTGETTLDNGLTVGFHAEAEADGGDGFEVEESYAFFAGNWGRVNFGAEDGAAYLLQVAAPAADTNVDGIRQYINPINYDPVEAGLEAFFGLAAGAADGTFDVLDYAQDASGYSDKLTYISPVFNGFQAAASWTPDVEDFNGGYANSFGVREDDVADSFGSAWEAAARYEGQFNAVRFALGGGYTQVDLEEDGGTGLDDLEAWNVGMNLGFGPFNVGGAYTEDNNGVDASAETETWVLGVDYTTGPFVIGASYLNQDTDLDDVTGGAGDELERERFSAGVTYTYGPGMTFRGSVHHVEDELALTGLAPGLEGDASSTSVLFGTQIGF